VATNIHLDQKFLHHMGKLLLNLTPGEPLSLMKNLLFFDDPIELYVLPVGSLCLSVHDPINYLLFNEVNIESYRDQELDYIRSLL
jgi:hypothetical protein